MSIFFAHNVLILILYFELGFLRWYELIMILKLCKFLKGLYYVIRFVCVDSEGCKCRYNNTWQDFKKELSKFRKKTLFLKEKKFTIFGKKGKEEGVCHNIVRKMLNISYWKLSIN
jgi:hypothetical protein